MRFSTRSLGLTAALLLLTCLPANSRADWVCPKFMWMDWGTHKSYYAIYIAGSNCNDVGYAANYDSNNVTGNLPKNCTDGNCVGPLLLATERGAKSSKSIVSIVNRHQHADPALRLHDKITEVDHEQKLPEHKYVKRVGPPDAFRWTEFCVIDANTNRPTRMKAVLQLIELERGPNAPTDPDARDYVEVPAFMNFAVGREVADDVKFRGRVPDFVRLPQNTVTRVSDYAIEVTIGSVTYLVVTHTPVAEIPPVCN